MKKRVIQAIFFIPFYSCILFIDVLIPVFNLFILAVSLVIVWEILHMADIDRYGDRRTIITTMIFMVFAYIVTVCGKNLFTNLDFSPLYTITKYEYRYMQFAMWLSILLITLLFIVNIFEKNTNFQNHSRAIFTALFAFTYAGICFWHFPLLRTAPMGKYNILIIHLCAWLADTGGYIIGSKFGKHKLLHTPSPNKSVEGFFGMFIFSIPAVLGIHYLATTGKLTFMLGEQIPNYSLTTMIILTIIFTMTGFLGDMAESLIKRAYNKKDSGSLFPGHGGVFDIFDSVILTMPIAYYIFILLTY